MLDEILIPIFGMLTSFGSIFGISYIYFTTRHKERMSLIDHGADPAIFKIESNPMRVLKWGMFFAGIGCGLLAGNWFWSALRMEPAVAFISMIFVGGGLGLMIFYLIQHKTEKKKS